MSAAPRALAVASRVAVLLWVGITLAWPGRDAALEPAPEPAVARVHPVREGIDNRQTPEAYAGSDFDRWCGGCLCLHAAD